MNSSTKESLEAPKQGRIDAHTSKTKRKKMRKGVDYSGDIDESVRSSSTVSSTSSNGNSNRRSKSKKKKSSKQRHHKKAKKESKKQNTDIEKHVGFSSVQVLEFRYTIGHQSVTEKGPPVALSYQLIRSEDHDLDSYERQKAKQIFTTESQLSPEKRFQILLEAGFSRVAIDQADEESRRVRVYRKQSVLQLHRDEWNERTERLHRLIRRWTNPKNLYFKGAHLIRGSLTKGGAEVVVY
ncbi:hypothetical protein IV203_013265 [Nitzschia inconspicua]|uniref:Uncharacterized protein n=1 Tax=Nitzschia inconspicua TaxID=303405 RepID=A0A9K3Q8P1_9STRA|nr:hypothetical protein IV203_013265 [Nitzschia inconspicua]